MSTVDITSDGATLILRGDLDVRSTDSVRAAIYDHLRRHDGRIVIDLHDVASVDLTALRVLGAASRRAVGRGDRIVLRGTSPQVLRMLHLTHLIRVVELERGDIAV
ncbi:STAS domain-containing protein [Nocardioides sp. GY 10113]|uniref:STAS domain-containing protein n=1 Tax=Nocardioides sp. GY 10113 TaxID=2569761 RepID=UPI001F0DD3CB|nr:STAS domain-containing protein [Nocardioides sp. GY 10113]